MALGWTPNPSINFPMDSQTLVSSSLSDFKAEEYRCATCTVAASVRNPEGSDWLADLHRSHRPFSGPYSICVHRPDAVTVSYTEVLVNSRLTSMRYVARSPCESTGFHHVLDLPRLSDESSTPGLLSESVPSPARSCRQIGTLKE